MVEVRRIEPSDGLYEQEERLRDRVLLHPIGVTAADVDRAFPGFAEKGEHWVAVMDHPTGPRVVGCAVLLVVGEGDERAGKVMQVATDEQLHGQGIGRKLMAAIERRAFGDLGMTKLYCHARGPVVGFYEKLGWRVVGEMFEEVGIEHYRMEVDGVGAAAEVRE